MQSKMTGLVSLAVVLGTGCLDHPTEPVVEDLRLSVVSGDRQVGRCYTELPAPIVVEVRERNVVVTGKTVNFRVLEGGGSVFGGSVLTDSRGRAADYWTLGGPGRQVVEARAVSANGSKQVFGRFTAFTNGADPGERSLNTPPTTIGQRAPAIYEDRVVYVRTTWPTPSSFYFNGVYLYDLKTSTERAISTVNPTGRVEGPVIYGDRIGWKEDRGQARFDIYLYDLAHEVEQVITADLPGTGDGPFRLPAIYGNRVVWLEDPQTILVYDISTGGRLTIALSGGGSSPSVYGDRIVWDEFSGSHKVFVYELSSGTRRQIITYPSNQLRPRIFGDRIVFLDDRYGNYDIFVYYLATNALSRISDDPAHELGPVIQGDRVVWWDFRSGHGELYLYDLRTQTERRLALTSFTFGDLPYPPAIWGDRIVWWSTRAAQAPEGIRVYELGICSRANP